MAERKIDLQYLKEALKEPVNFWGMAGFAVAAAYTQSVIPLAAALVTEGMYLATVPASSLYRRYIDARNRKRLYEERKRHRHHGRGQQSQPFDQAECRVVTADRLEAVPLLDEVDVDAEVQRGE